MTFSKFFRFISAKQHQDSVDYIDAKKATKGGGGFRSESLQLWDDGLSQ
ncbi:hypothetical protein ABE527_11105 [Brucella sp. TWI432]